MPFSIAGPSAPALPSMDGINKAVDSISSGQRVSYQTNAAEAAISGRLDTSIGESTVTIRNAINQISSLQKADQSLGQVADIFERIQSLSIQAGNSALSDSDQKVINAESQQLLNDASEILESAKFNGNKLFSESSIDIERLQSKLEELRNSGTPVDLEAIASVQDELNLKRAETGARENAISSQVGTLESDLLASQAARSDLVDTDYAEAFANLIKEELIFKASVKVFNHRIESEESLINMLTE